jgi:hypothetical protein
MEGPNRQAESYSIHQENCIWREVLSSTIKLSKLLSSSFQGLGLLACSGSEFSFLNLMNLLDSW